ncbi:SGNH/GDSL hydrolase family protein [Streptomyces buecherae]|uniref:SGNH/GDSL hydrolase family protein n=1 Tax=Streptomyces buecherae TaxID=2763006 RepID=UPI001C9AA676|nr:SGNH/GDSL hydrolase family protein [Streptomyces buecherae]
MTAWRAPGVRPTAPPPEAGALADTGAPAAPGTPTDRDIAAGRGPAGPASAAPGPADRAAPFRFVALGDSLTAGVGDPAPGGGWRGWAALLAGALVPEDAPDRAAEPDGGCAGTAGADPDPARSGHLAGGPYAGVGGRLDGRPRRVEFVNLARSGALVAEMVEGQLPAARRSRPELASVVVGGNDTLRAAFDIGQLARALDLAMRALRADGAVLLTACLPDPGRALGLPRPLAAPLTRRTRALNTVVHVLARRYGAVHAHLAGCAWVTDRAARGVDRLHPSELGHRLLAREFHAALGRRGARLGPAPSVEPDGPPPTFADGTWWLATRGTRWVFDRCRDLLPDLVRQAALESGHHLTGTAHLLDARARAATRGALTATRGAPARALRAGSAA